MTNVTMKAVDTIHISNAGPDNIEPGGTFEVGEGEAKILEDRGLATRVGTKAEPAPQNKDAGPAPANKSRKAK
jgi:hypothetical protein